MSNIGRISFLAETTGSPAYLTKGSKSTNNPIVEKPTPRTETTGSPAYSRLGVLNKTQNNYDTVSFKGETTGSPAYSTTCPEGDCPNVPQKGDNNVSFKSHYNSYQTEKKGSPLTYLAIAGGIAASAIAGLGYAHKSKAIGKMSDGSIKNIIEPTAKKCHEWCHSVKTNAIELKKKWF